MGTSGAFFNYKRSMYNLKVYTSNIYVVNYGDTVAKHGSVYIYTGLARLNYQKEEWVVHYSRPLNICVLVILSIYILYLYIYIYTPT